MAKVLTSLEFAGKHVAENEFFILDRTEHGEGWFVMSWSGGEAWDVSIDPLESLDEAQRLIEELA